MKKFISITLPTKIASINPWIIISSAAVVRTIFLVFFCLTTKTGLGYLPLQGTTLQHAGIDGYIQIARTLITSGEYAFEPGGLPVPFRPPMQPLLMLIFGAWAPVHWYVIWLGCSVTLGTATVWLLWRTARITKLSPLLTRILLLACAFHPYLIFATRVPGIPSALIFMTTLVVYATVAFITSNGKNTVVTGIAWGLAALTHGCFLPLLIPTCIFMTRCMNGSWLHNLRRSVIVAITALIVISPWTIRNWIAFDRFIPVATGGALQYWIADYVYFHSDLGNNNPVSESFKRIPSDFNAEHGRELSQVHGGILKLKDDIELSSKAKKQLISDPSLLLSRMLKGSLLFWVTMDKGIKKTIIVSLLNLPFIILAMVTLPMVILRRFFTKEYLFFAFFTLIFWSLFAMVQAVGPYFVAITPCLLFMICYGFDLLSHKRTSV